MYDIILIVWLILLLYWLIIIAVVVIDLVTVWRPVILVWTRVERDGLDLKLIEIDCTWHLCLCVCLSVNGSVTSRRGKLATDVELSFSTILNQLLY